MDSQSEMVGLLVGRLDPLMDARVEPIMTALGKITQMLAAQQEMLEHINGIVQPQERRCDTLDQGHLDRQESQQQEPAVPVTPLDALSSQAGLEGIRMGNEEKSTSSQAGRDGAELPRSETVLTPTVENSFRAVKPGEIEKFNIAVNEAGLPSIVRWTHQQWQDSSYLHKVIRSPRFDFSMLGLITLSALIMGVQLEYQASTGEVHWSDLPINIAFTAVFAIELIMRLAGEGVRTFLCGKARSWAWLDIFTVGVSLLDVYVSLISKPGFINISSVRVVRLLRVLRVARVIRGVRFLRDLRLLISGMINSVIAIGWTVVALAFIKYVGAVVIMSLVMEDITAGAAYYENSWGGIGASIFTLFQVMTGDAWWTEVVEGIKYDYPGIQLFFIVYFSFTAYGLLNIVTGIFVDQTLGASRSDYELLKQSRDEETKSIRKFLGDLFELMDVSGDGMVSQEELGGLLRDHHIAFALGKVDINPDEAMKLFILLDTGGDGLIDVEEFVNGCMKIRCVPTKADIMAHNLKTTSMLRDIKKGVADLKRKTSGEHIVI